MNHSSTRGSLLLGAAIVASLAAGTASAERLTIGLAAPATSMDPHFHNLGPNNQIAAHIFDRIVSQDETQRIVPGLAESWGPIDPLTWEFRLRPGMTWHDGTPVTADDVICSYERAPNVPNSPAGYGLYLRGKTAVKIDDLTVHVKTESPYPLMANDLATVSIVSAHAGCNATTDDFNAGRATIGTGPFKFRAFVPGERIELVRNDNYWGDAPEFSEVLFRAIPSDPSRVAALLAGDVDMVEVVPTADMEMLARNNRVALNTGVSNRVIYMHMDHWRETSPHITARDGSAIPNPLRDLRVRRALSMAIDREAIRDFVMEGQSIPAGQLLPEGFFGRSPNLEADPYDPAAARALLAEAGFPNGFRMLAHGPNDRYTNDAQILEAIAQMFAQVGVETSIETMTNSVFFNRASQGDNGQPEFSFILVGWGAGSGEASSPLRSLLATFNRDKGMGAANRGRYSNPEFDAVLEQALQTVDDAEREALLAKATDIGVGDLGIIPIHYQVNTWATRAGLVYTPRTDEYTLAQFVRAATN